MDKALKHLIGECVSHLAIPKVYRATLFISEKFIIRASYPREAKRDKKGRKTGGKTVGSKKGKLTALITIGTPNSRERDFIKMCKKAGEKFPIKKVQLKFVK